MTQFHCAPGSTLGAPHVGSTHFCKNISVNAKDKKIHAKNPVCCLSSFHKTFIVCQSSRRSSGKNHTVEDGWFTVALSRVYPKPSPLPDLRLETEAIAWDNSWTGMENEVQKTLRYLLQSFFRPHVPITIHGGSSSNASRRLTGGFCLEAYRYFPAGATFS